VLDESVDAEVQGCGSEDEGAGADELEEDELEEDELDEPPGELDEDDELDELPPDEPGCEDDVDGAGLCLDVGPGAGDVDGGDDVVPDGRPRGLPGSTGGSVGCPPPGSGVVGSTGTVIPTAPLAYASSTLITNRT